MDNPVGGDEFIISSNIDDKDAPGFIIIPSDFLPAEQVPLLLNQLTTAFEQTLGATFVIVDERPLPQGGILRLMDLTALPSKGRLAIWIAPDSNRALTTIVIFAAQITEFEALGGITLLTSVAQSIRNPNEEPLTDNPEPKQIEISSSNVDIVNIFNFLVGELNDDTILDLQNANTASLSIISEERRVTLLAILQETIQQIKLAQDQGYDDILRVILKDYWLFAAQAQPSDPLSPIVIELLAMKQTTPFNKTSINKPLLNQDISPLLIPNALAVLALNLRKTQQETLQGFWMQIMQLRPDLARMFAELESSLAMELDKDLHALLLSLTEQEAVLTLLGNLSQEDVLETFKVGNILLSAKSLPEGKIYYKNLSEQSEDIILSFVSQGLIMGSEVSVLSLLSTYSASKLAFNSEEPLFQIALREINSLAAEYNSTYFQETLQQLYGVYLALDLQGKMDITFNLDFTSVEGARAFNAMLQILLVELTLSQDPNAKQLEQNMVWQQQGASLNGHISFPQAIYQGFLDSLVQNVAERVAIQEGLEQYLSAYALNMWMINNKALFGRVTGYNPLLPY